MISIRNLTKRFDGVTILEHVDLEIDKGDSVVIIGGSGCGKSTLLRCINRLIVPEEGEILIDGENILAKNADVDAIRRKMGMVYQQFNLFSPGSADARPGPSKNTCVDNGSGGRRHSGRSSDSPADA